MSKKNELILPGKQIETGEVSIFHNNSGPQDIAKCAKMARSREMKKRMVELKKERTELVKKHQAAINAQHKAVPSKLNKSEADKVKALIKALNSLAPKDKHTSEVSFDSPSIDNNEGEAPGTINATILVRRHYNEGQRETLMRIVVSTNSPATLKSADKKVINSKKACDGIEEKIIQLQEMICELDSFEEEVHAELVAVSLRSSSSKNVRALMDIADQVVKNLNPPALPGV